MSSFDNPNQTGRGARWLGIVKTLLAQIVVLLALSGALIAWLSWSSDAARAAFMDAGTPSVFEPARHAQSSAPIQIVKGSKACAWKA